MDIRKADALELLKSLDDKSVDLILTDPPYYRLLNVEWDKQWKTKEDYLIWLDSIVGLTGLQNEFCMKTSCHFVFFCFRVSSLLCIL